MTKIEKIIAFIRSLFCREIRHFHKKICAPKSVLPGNLNFYGHLLLCMEFVKNLVVMVHGGGSGGGTENDHNVQPSLGPS